MSLGQYARFLVVGAVVGVITVVCRELIGHLLAADSVTYYSLSVVLAYTVGIVLAYMINHRFTFADGADSMTGSQLSLYALVALAGALCTWVLSLVLRYGAHLNALLGDSSGTVAFALATLLSSLITYPLNARFVFRRSR